MTSSERIAALCNAVEYIAVNNIPGSIVECGVWRGGSAMAAMMTLNRLGLEREFYLFDTFEGMSEPDGRDVNHRGESAFEIMKSKDHAIWCRASLEEASLNIQSIGYPMGKVKFIIGDVLKTLPQCVPTAIALLRLDTDWYSSTKHELEHLYPKLSPNGVLIIDDYGHWNGARRAVDEYFAGRVLCHRIDYTGRLVVKT